MNSALLKRGNVSHRGTKMTKNPPVPLRALTYTVLCASLVTLSAGCNRTAAPEVLVAQAEKFHQAGDEKAALIQLKNALKAAPQNARARQLLGSVYLAEGDAVSADVELRKALALGAAPVAVYGELGKAMLAQGQYQLLLDQTATLAAQSPDLLAQRGDAWLGLGDSAKAQDEYQHALGLKADNVEALVGMGKRASLEHDWAGAASYADQAVKFIRKTLVAGCCALTCCARRGIRVRRWLPMTSRCNCNRTTSAFIWSRRISRLTRRKFPRRRPNSTEPRKLRRTVLPSSIRVRCCKCRMAT